MIFHSKNCKNNICIILTCKFKYINKYFFKLGIFSSVREVSINRSSNRGILNYTLYLSNFHIKLSFKGLVSSEILAVYYKVIWKEVLNSAN